MFPPSFPQWRRHEVGHGPSRTANSQERRPLIEEETDTDEDSEPTQEEQGVCIKELLLVLLHLFILMMMCMMVHSDNCTGHALFLMTEDKHTGPLTFTDQLHIIKVRPVVCIYMILSLVFLVCLNDIASALVNKYVL